ncbi:MAG: MrcB family domain-containing protein [Chitinophagales bacterium]
MKEDIKEILSAFFVQVEKSDHRTGHYPSFYSGLKIKVGFGIGRTAKIPWITFLGKGQTPQDGIFPVYYFFKENHKLILAYGISETNIPKKKWNVSQNTKTVEKYFESLRISPHKYHSSYVYEVYDTYEDLDWNKIESDLDSLIEKYKPLVS